MIIYNPEKAIFSPQKEVFGMSQTYKKFFTYRSAIEEVRAGRVQLALVEGEREVWTHIFCSDKDAETFVSKNENCYILTKCDDNLVYPGHKWVFINKPTYEVMDLVASS